MNKLMKKISFLLLCSLLFACHQKEIEKTNFLFILVDDLGYADLSCMGSKYYESPNIDNIAAKGVKFVNSYSACPVCSPSRASIMTGKLPARHGITEYIGALSGNDWRKRKRYTKLLPASYKHYLNQEETTIAEALKENGYATFFAGKWHLGGADNHSLPTDHGFDINKGGYESGGPGKGGYFAPYKNPYLPDVEEEKGMNLSMRLAKETVKFMAQNKDTSFLAYLSFYAVHAPIETTQEKWIKYRNKADSMGIHKQGFEMERILPVRKYQDNPVYAGLIEHVDEAVGMVLQSLKELGLDKNTVVIFTSDNGGVVSGDNFSTNSLMLRGGKGYQWEGGTRVPLFIDVPWINNEGMMNKTPVSGVDLYPTILELAGIPLMPNQHKDGVSLVPLLKGENIGSRALYWHYPHYGNQGGEPSSVIREGDWKLIHYWEDDHDELYHLDEDISEKSDQALRYPEITSRLKTKLLAWLKDKNVEYAIHDPLFNADSCEMILKRNKEVLWPRLEKKRKEMLDPNWQPNQDWWGSAKPLVTK